MQSFTVFCRHKLMVIEKAFKVITIRRKFMLSITVKRSIIREMLLLFFCPVLCFSCHILFIIEIRVMQSNAEQNTAMNIMCGGVRQNIHWTRMSRRRWTLYCIVLYCTVLYCTVLYCTVLYCTVLYCTILYCIVLYYTVLYCNVLHSTILKHSAPICTALHCAAMYQW